MAEKLEALRKRLAERHLQEQGVPLYEMNNNEERDRVWRAIEANGVRIDELRDSMRETITQAVKDAMPHALLTDEEHRYVQAAIKREAQKIAFRQSVIDKTLTGLVWALVVGLGDGKGISCGSRVESMNVDLKFPIWPTRIAVVLLVMFMSMLSYLIWLEPPWLTYTNSPFQLKKMQLKRGESIVFDVARCSTATVTRLYGLSRRLECNETATGALQTVPLPPTTQEMSPGCYSEIRAVVVPQETLIGWCRLHSTAETQGVVRSQSVETESKLFEVIE